MYKSPIEIIFGDMSRKFEGDILKAIQKYDVVIDKEGLLRALRYDRGQYETGYAEGKADAMADLVRCKDCQFSKYFEESGTRKCRTQGGLYRTVQDGDFCSYGERRAGE